MHKNIKHLQVGLVSMGALIFMWIASQTALAENTGVTLARETLMNADALAQQFSGASNVNQRDQAIDNFHKETSEKLSRLTSSDRIDYAEYMANVLAQARTGGPMSNLAEVALVFITAGPSTSEALDGVSRLLSSDNPNVREVGESLFTPSATKLPNGQIGQDIATFDVALQDPKVRKDRLVSALFRLAPVETAQWLADHANLPADERAGLESDLQKAWQLHRALNDPSADPGTKAILDDKVKKTLLDHWLNGQSWILRSLANGLLQREIGEIVGNRGNRGQAAFLDRPCCPKKVLGTAQSILLGMELWARSNERGTPIRIQILSFLLIPSNPSSHPCQSVRIDARGDAGGGK